MTLPAGADRETLWTIEAWRGLAALLVMYAHFAPPAGVDVPLLRFAHTGVDLFFVLSGFVFAPYYAGRPLPIAAFAIRRLFRIYPAYAVALALYAWIKWHEGAALDYLWEHLTFTHLQSKTMAFHYNPVFWSLAPEVEYYLALPLMAALAARTPRGFAAMLALALVGRVLLGHASDPAAENRAFIWLVHLPGMAVEFMFGVLAWRAAPRLRSPLTRLLMFAAGVLAWFLLAALFGKLGDPGIDAGPLRGQMSWLAAGAFAAMLAATATPPRAAPEMMIRLGVLLGRLSYGVYLLHIAALWAVAPLASTHGAARAVVAACGLTLVSAWLLNLLWEEPMRKLGRRLSRRLEPSGAGPANAG